MPKPKRKQYLGVWAAEWDDVAIIRPGCGSTHQRVKTFTVAANGREAAKTMGDGLLGFGDVEGSATKPRWVRRVQSGKGLHYDVGALLGGGSRFVAPHARLGHDDIAALISRLKLYG